MYRQLRFLLSFFLCFTVFYCFHIGYIGATSKGGIYFALLDRHFNYITLWRHAYISIAACTLDQLGYIVYTTDTTLKVYGHSGFRLVYSCLGYGVMSFFSAFVLTFPKPIRSRIIFLVSGLAVIFILNLSRFILMPLFYNPRINVLSINHHDIFNISLYLVIIVMIYRWVNSTPNCRR